MSYYSIVLFLHIVGALGFFAALGLEWTSVQQIRSATTSDKVRDWMRISKSARNPGIISMLTLLISGIYMMATVWGHIAWIVVAFGALILVIVLSVALTVPRMAAIGRALAAEKGPVTQGLQHLTNHPYLWISIQARVAIALGIVFLMTVKPDLGGSLLTIGVAIVLGLASALPNLRREQAQGEPAA